MNTVEKMPHFDKEVEEGALAGLINSPHKIFNSNLQKNDFYLKKHQLIFEVIRELNGKEIDTTLLMSKFKKAGIESPATTIAKFGISYTTQKTLEDYFKKIKEDSIKRKIDRASKIVSSLVYDEEIEDVNELLAKSQKEVMKINTLEKENASGKEIVEQLEKAQAEFTEKYQSGEHYIGVPTGIDKLDNVIDGMRKGHIWVIGAWASTGKSSFLLNIIGNVMEKTPISLVSLEMSKVDIGAKLIGIRSMLTQQGVIKSLPNSNTLDKINEGKEFIRNGRLKIYTECFKLDEIKMIIRKDVYVNKTRVVAIDYAQNILGSGQKEYQLMTDIAQELQALARELQITIIILSQISNESAKGGGAGAGFKGSGAFEAVADLAIKLKRNRKDEIPGAETVYFEIDVAKNRHGFTGVIDDYHLHLKSGRLIKQDLTIKK